MGGNLPLFPWEHPNLAAIFGSSSLPSTLLPTPLPQPLPPPPPEAHAPQVAVGVDPTAAEDGHRPKVALVGRRPAVKATTEAEDREAVIRKWLAVVRTLASDTVLGRQVEDMDD